MYEPVFFVMSGCRVDSDFVPGTQPSVSRPTGLRNGATLFSDTNQGRLLERHEENTKEKRNFCRVTSCAIPADSPSHTWHDEKWLKRVPKQTAYQKTKLVSRSADHPSNPRFDESDPFSASLPFGNPRVHYTSTSPALRLHLHLCQMSLQKAYPSPPLNPRGPRPTKNTTNRTTQVLQSDIPTNTKATVHAAGYYVPWCARKGRRRSRK